MGSIFAGLLLISFYVALAVGWVLNLIDVIGLAVANSPLATLFVLKVVGIFVVPLGSILGLFF